MQIKFKNKKYKLLFSNNLKPLIALNYADEKFFLEFKKLCGARYRILSIIKKGWQEKYGLNSDLEKLRKTFLLKVSNYSYANKLLKSYLINSNDLKILIKKIDKMNFSSSNNIKLVNTLFLVRKKSAMLDAMSNMLYLFSVLAGEEFLNNLKRYSNDNFIINENLVFYTQPIKESRFAKIKIKSLKNKIKLTKKDENFSKLLKLGAFVKDDVSDLLSLRNEKMQKLYQEIAKRLHMSKGDVEYLQLSEIKEFLLKQNKQLNKKIKKRKKITTIFYANKKIDISEGSEAEIFLKQGKLIFFDKKIIIKHDILKGQTACPGLAVGIARVANNSDEANKKIKKGDILVAPYTAVEYLPAMKKAAAIITETGGITSHAAIVSRELGSPCIIGVKDVTKVLKSGQKIEVDANKGIVKILKKK